MSEAPKTTWVRCGNCKKQYEVPVEQPARYNAVQAHKQICPEGSLKAVEEQRAQLIRQFAEQEARKEKDRPRWWQFWKRL